MLKIFVAVLLGLITLAGCQKAIQASPEVVARQTKEIATLEPGDLIQLAGGEVVVVNTPGTRSIRLRSSVAGSSTYDVEILAGTPIKSIGRKGTPEWTRLAELYIGH